MALALALVVAGCSFGSGGRSAYITPPDPPPVPPVKPVAKPITKPVTAAAWTPPAASQGASERVHVITEGQSLYAVARLYGITVAKLIETNLLAPPYKLALGQRLVVPGAAAPSTPVQTAVVQTAAPAAPAAPQRPVAAQVVPAAVSAHVVKSGDTVFSIARRYKVDMAELVSLNAIPASYRISPGQRLMLPGQAKTAVAGLASGSTKLSAAVTPTPQPAVAAMPPPEVTGPVGKPPARAGDKFLWPVEGKLLTKFGPKRGGLHNDGINIAAPRGSPVRAAENGVVAYVGNELRGFGNLLLIKHDDGWMTAYAHNEAILVGRGAKVKRGQTVARVGDSGSVVTPQLHFEIRRGTRAVDPTKQLGPRQSAQNM